jgi:hypothetical protein
MHAHERRTWSSLAADVQADILATIAGAEGKC